MRAFKCFFFVVVVLFYLNVFDQCVLYLFCYDEGTFIET